MDEQLRREVREIAQAQKRIESRLDELHTLILWLASIGLGLLATAILIHAINVERPFELFFYWFFAFFVGVVIAGAAYSGLSWLWGNNAQPG